MNAPLELSAAARASKSRAGTAARSDYATGAPVSSFVTGNPAGQHSQLLLTATVPVLAIPVPRLLYRTLAWRYWLLTLIVGVACWWALLALL